MTNAINLSCGSGGCCLIVPIVWNADSDIHNVLKAMLAGQRYDSQFLLFTLTAFVGVLDCSESA